MDAIERMRTVRKELPTDEPNQLVAPWTPALPSSAPAGPKKIHKRLAEAGWEVWIERSEVLVGRTYFQSKEKAGEMKKERHTAEYWQVRGRLRRAGKMVGAFQGVWKKTKGCAFEDAFTWDVVTKERALVEKMGEVEAWLDILAPKKDATRKSA